MPRFRWGWWQDSTLKFISSLLTLSYLNTSSARAARFHHMFLHEFQESAWAVGSYSTDQPADGRKNYMTKPSCTSGCDTLYFNRQSGRLRGRVGQRVDGVLPLLRGYARIRSEGQVSLRLMSTFKWPETRLHDSFWNWQITNFPFNTRDLWLSPGGIMLPVFARLYISAFSNQHYYEQQRQVSLWGHVPGDGMSFEQNCLARNG